MHKFKLVFAPKKLKEYADKFEYESDDPILKIGQSAKEKKYLTKDEFIQICAWKTKRSKSKVAKNSEEFIKEITHISFTTQSDQLRIEILTLLNGVGWPTASTILHFCHPELKFPILDFRAIESLGISKPPNKYDYLFWKGYIDCCRKLSKMSGLDMRTVDKALWQYSKEMSI